MNRAQKAARSEIIGLLGAGTFVGRLKILNAALARYDAGLCIKAAGRIACRVSHGAIFRKPLFAVWMWAISAPAGGRRPNTRRRQCLVCGGLLIGRPA